MHLLYPLLVTDLDGTLLTSSKKISNIAKTSIDYFRDCGGRFTVATGRSLTECKIYLDELCITEPVILNNGAALYLPEKGKIVPLFTLPHPLLVKLLAEISALPIKTDILLHSSTSVYVRRMRPITRESLEMYGVRYRIFPPGMQLREPIFKLQMIGTVDEIAFLRDWTQNHPLTNMAEFVQVADECLEILPLQASKGEALRKVLDMIGISAIKTAVLGDHYNDISMLQEVALAAVVGNAHPIAKKYATHVVPTNDKNGISTLIEHYLLVKARKNYI